MWRSFNNCDIILEDHQLLAWGLMLNNVLIENISSMISEREKNEPHRPRAIVITRGQSKSSRHRLVMRLGYKLPMRVCQALTGHR
jgi:hypothetical protein